MSSTVGQPSACSWMKRRWLILANLTVISLDQALFASLATRLVRSIAWSITITEGILYLTTGVDTLESAIQVKMGNR